MLVVLMFSGGGTRAAALGYGVLEELDKQPLYKGGRQQTMLDAVDLVYGVSGGSVLAAYFSLHGRDTIPAFERRFLKQNFQRQVSKQIFSFANLPRLTSPEFGRGDLLQEQFETTLFKNATFGDLHRHGKGPFAVITATDMSAGNRFEFTQEYFDAPVPEPLRPAHRPRRGRIQRGAAGVRPAHHQQQRRQLRLPPARTSG